ncbi:hypothetical protein LTR70_001837 [Exophiala xenobiotica]|uniref:WW domain-containing protein n=1 Tax=Lithohypha guttulata TaxID=1690604 RepID=A0ABR0KM35_9EURO|nr:hypothetical protein LTR24_000969 [Lithohypha guttulata]KAK5327095.1 hypothetical protein LTR70_001837 [Exophiala xenobiotica]
MLRSTHRVAAAHVSSATAPLPPGWTEHRAPTGHLYYYNADTKQSTYIRPVPAPELEELLIDYGATKPDQEMQASLNAMQEFHRNNDPNQQSPGHFTAGRSYQDRNRDPSRPNRQGDRPKSKTPIPDCAPWLLVKTKYGRRFVHNTETKESLWKFPSEVMMAVIDMDRLEWEKNMQAEDQKHHERAEKEALAQQAEPSGAAKPPPEAYDSDEYEEVEVTDDEAETGADPASKRQRLDADPDRSMADQPPPGPQEFDEDDIAWQLAQLEAEEEDPGYDYDFDDQDDEDGGTPLTKDDRDALFRVMLDDHRISPFSTFDALIDTNTPTANAVITDDRWTALPNMSARRAAFDAWSRDRVAERNANEAAQDSDVGLGSTGTAKRPGKLDPKVAYLRFLAREATPKLYWPEFKRKYRKAPEMTDRYFADKDREKLYREYITKLKVSDAERKKEFSALLKSTKPEDWLGADVPLTVERDLAFYGVRDEKSRGELASGFKATFR